MKNWFTVWLGRDLEVHGFELPDDPTDADRELAGWLTVEIPKLRASEAGTDYMEPVSVPDDAVATTRLRAVSSWFDPGKT